MRTVLRGKKTSRRGKMLRIWETGKEYYGKRRPSFGVGYKRKEIAVGKNPG